MRDPFFAQRWPRAIRLALILMLIGLGGGDAAGQPPGRALLRDIAPGATDSKPSGFVTLGGLAFFGAYAPDTGDELYATDGTPAGTRLVADTLPGAAGMRVLGMAGFNGRLAFLRQAGSGIELWTSDGTADGTARMNTMPGLGAHSSMVAFQGGLVFMTTSWENSQSYFHLWVWDGTPGGARMMATIGGPSGSDVGGFGALRVIGGEIYAWYSVFSFGTRTSSATLYQFDGQELTGLVSCSAHMQRSCGGLAALGDEAVFYDSGALIFVGGTARRSLDLGGLGIIDFPSFNQFGDRLLIGATDAAGRIGLWRSDGTVAGSQRLLNEGEAGATFSISDVATETHGRAYFRVYRHATELWRTDGTAGGTRLVAQMPQDVHILAMTAVGPLLALTIWEQTGSGRELWQISAPDAAPQLLADVNPGTASSLEQEGPGRLALVGGGLLWAASDPSAGLEPRWVGFSPPSLPPVWAGAPSGGEATAPLRFDPGLTAGEPLFLTLRLPDGVELRSQTIGGPPIVENGVLKWPLGSLPPGERQALLRFRLPEAPTGSAYTATVGLEPLGLAAPISLEIALPIYLPEVRSAGR